MSSIMPQTRYGDHDTLVTEYKYVHHGRNPVNVYLLSKWCNGHNVKSISYNGGHYHGSWNVLDDKQLLEMSFNSKGDNNLSKRNLTFEEADFGTGGIVLQGLPPWTMVTMSAKDIWVRSGELGGFQSVKVPGEPSTQD